MESKITTLQKKLSIVNRDHDEPTEIFVLEEMAELQKELIKNRRGFDNKLNIVEEACDVLCVVMRLLMEYEVSQYYVENIILYKLIRALEQIQGSGAADDILNSRPEYNINQNGEL